MEKNDTQSYEARIQLNIEEAKTSLDQRKKIEWQLKKTKEENRSVKNVKYSMVNYQINTPEQLREAENYQLPPRHKLKNYISWLGFHKKHYMISNNNQNGESLVNNIISITSTIRSNLNSGDDSKLEDRQICELSYEQYEQRYGIKLDDIEVKPLSDTFGYVHECNANTENLKFEVKCGWIKPRNDDITRLVYDSNEYMSVVRWNGCVDGSITIWVNKNNTIFNILSIIIKCTDRIYQEWTFYYHLTIILLLVHLSDAFLHTKTITTAMNKYDSHMMVKLHRQINMIENKWQRWYHMDIYTIWLYIAVCCNHINDDVIDVSCSMGKETWSIKDMQNKEYSLKLMYGIIVKINLLSHINEIRNLHLYEVPRKDAFGSSNQAELSELAELKEKRLPTDLLPKLPQIKASENLIIEASDQPLEWINKESIQKLLELLQIVEDYQEELEEAFLKKQGELTSVEAKKQLEEEFVNCKKAAKDMLRVLRTAFSKKAASLVA